MYTVFSTRVCYRTQVDDPFFPTTCTPTVIPASNFSHRFLPGDPTFPGLQVATQTKIFSPGNLRGRNYQNRRLCRYNVVCPPGTITYVSWVGTNFNLEPEDPNEGCLDRVFINRATGQTEFCGIQRLFTDITTVPLNVEFRSNTVNRFPGFRIDVLCVNETFTMSNSNPEPAVAANRAANVNPAFASIQFADEGQSSRQCCELPDLKPRRYRKNTVSNDY